MCGFSDEFREVQMKELLEPGSIEEQISMFGRSISMNWFDCSRHKDKESGLMYQVPMEAGISGS